MLIRLTRKDDGTTFYLNANKILSIVPVEGGDGCTIYHEPYNIENAYDWVTVKQSAQAIANRELIA